MSGETIHRVNGVERSVPPRNAAEARRRVAAVLYERFCPAHEALSDDIVFADALLVTSELVTNAVRHAGGVTAFSAEVTEEGLRLSVEDALEAFPRNDRSATSDGPRFSGHGWPLVRRVATRVDIRPLPGGGKRITVLLPLM